MAKNPRAPKCSQCAVLEGEKTEAQALVDKLRPRDRENSDMERMTAFRHATIALEAAKKAIALHGKTYH